MGTASKSPAKAKVPFSALKTRTKRSFNAIDTNVTSYDRKDPFAAFNVLRKLLSSLPMRMGSSQFKMSPEEQKLAMHLMTIIEPFINALPSRRTLTRLPAEILDEIVGNIDSKRDLLALALTCRRMYDIIFPRHYSYRDIRCKVSSISVWHHLNSHRLLSANVRRLEILDERSTETALVPLDILGSDTDLESSDDELIMHDKQERLFISALTKMTSLHQFVWSCSHSLVSLHNIWPFLLNLHSLYSVEIGDNLVFCASTADDGKSSDKRQLILPSLSTVTIHSANRNYGKNKNPELTRVTNMLHHCPNLEELDIKYLSGSGLFSNPRADNLFQFGRWPSLRSLCLTNLTCSLAAFDAASTFFLAHLNIEVLHLDLGRSVGAFVLPPNALPRLRELKASKEFANVVMSCPSDVQRPLEVLKGVRLSGHSWDNILLDNLKKYPIKRLELAGYNEFEDIKKLVDCIPKVTWLDVGKKVNAVQHKLGPSFYSSVADWAELLSQLPNLTAFHGVHFFYAVPDGTGPNSSSSGTLSNRSRQKKNEEVAAILSWKCPKLRRLDYWDETQTKIIVLVKDGDPDKVKWEIRRLKPSE